VPSEITAEPAAPTVPPTAGMTTKVVKGSLWTLVGQVLPLAVSLVTTPFVIRMLGAENYGVLILVGLIPTYLGFADFGMSIASTKFASEAYAAGDTRREASIVRTAALIALCSSLPIALVMFALSSQIISLFNVPDALRSTASLALKFAAVTFVLNFLNGIFNTPQLTRLRMDLNTLVNAGFRILGLAATPFAVYMYGIVGAVFVLMIASLLTLFGHLAISNRLDKHLFEFTIDRSVIQPMVKFGTGLVGASIAAVLLINAEKGILAATVSASALAHYSVAFTVASMMTIFSSAMIQSLVPAFSQLQLLENRPQLSALYSRGVRLSLIWLIPALVFLAIVAKPFFAVWAGDEYAKESTIPFYVLLLGLAFNIIAFLPNAAILAAGKTAVLAKLYWLELAIYSVVVWFLASRYGAVGAAAAWSFRVITDAIVQLVLAKRVAGVKFHASRIVSFSFASIIMLFPALVNLYADTNGIVIMLFAVVCFSAYIFIVLKTLEDEEFSWLSTRMSDRLARLRP
jgi:O-antigen/teichoic acid export membrane protein